MAEMKQRDCSSSLSILLRKYTVFNSVTSILLMNFSFLFPLILFILFLFFYFYFYFYFFCQN